MLWLYNFAIFFYGLLIGIASLFDHKAKLFLKGRKDIFPLIKSKLSPGSKSIWFHFASLGEFEQGRPVLEKLKSIYPEKDIIITFFSPSGYEIRKNYALAHAVFYLPLDTASNAKRFIQMIDPEIVIFTKYEFWYHYFKVLHDRKTPLLLISGIFRPGQAFFKWYGGFSRETLKFVTHFFVQNEESVDLLKSIEVNNVTLSGDTRFDRVAEHAKLVGRNQLIERFTSSSPVLIAGSTWSPDESLISAFMIEHAEWKLILAPHEIGTAHIEQIEKLFPRSVRYSELERQPASPASVLIIDNIGLLSSLYQYGSVCYIGGGFGVGIHNTLEAAAFGMPIIFGPNYGKFQEAKDLIKLGAAKSVGNPDELQEAFNAYSANLNIGQKAKSYVNEKKGATAQIVTFIETYINKSSNP
jgi:3-deoxy-D-manno-octulosonic-acid transferase